MASYNRWQNESIFTAADKLNDAERKQDRGSFFRSIQSTLNHLLWGDKIWLHRFANTACPNRDSIQQSINECENWNVLKTERLIVDDNIDKWASELNERELADDLSWHSGAIGKHVTKPKAICVVHFFNHQTHHRGQVHAMLTSAGVKPDDTDIPFLPDNYLLKIK